MDEAHPTRWSVVRFLHGQREVIDTWLYAEDARAEAMRLNIDRAGTYLVVPPSKT